MEKLLKLFGLNDLSGEMIEVMLPTIIIAAVLLVIAIVLMVDSIENKRIRRWVDQNTGMDIPMTRWRTIVPWHREGSRWFMKHFESNVIHYGVKSIHEADSATREDALYRRINKTTRVGSSQFAKGMFRK